MFLVGRQHRENFVNLLQGAGHIVYVNLFSHYTVRNKWSGVNNGCLWFLHNNKVVREMGP
jgi:hypothetical protein